MVLKTNGPAAGKEGGVYLHHPHPGGDVQGVDGHAVPESSKRAGLKAKKLIPINTKTEALRTQRRQCGLAHPPPDRQTREWALTQTGRVTLGKWLHLGLGQLVDSYGQLAVFPSQPSPLLASPLAPLDTIATH